MPLANHHGVVAQDNRSGTTTVTPDLSSEDLAAFNHWLSLTRIRAAAALGIFVLILTCLGIREVRVGPVLGVCAAMIAFSIFARWSALGTSLPRAFFYAQSAVDIIGITIGIAVALPGHPPPRYFSLLYVLVVVASSLTSVRAGLVCAALAAAGHLTLVTRSDPSLGTLVSLPALTPVFLYFLVAQQCFFYAGHLADKNRTLVALADGLEHSRRRLADLIQIARTVNSTMDPRNLLAQLNDALLAQFGASWGCTFLVDPSRSTFQLVAESGNDHPELRCIDLPLDGFPTVSCLAHEPIVSLDRPRARQLAMALGAEPQPDSVVLAGLYRDRALIGFLALGYSADVPNDPALLEQVAAVAEHSTIALGNAQLLEEARAASALKSEFLSTVSHELRTPLNVIMGYTEMLRDGAAGRLTQPQRDLFDRIDLRARELFELIEATLQVGRLESGPGIVLAPVRVDALLINVRSALAGLPRNERVDFRWNVDPDLAGVVVTDPAKVALIVRNLVGNALKFTDTGFVEVRFSQRIAHLVVEVRDTGVGIAPKDLPVIFEMFRQIGGERAHRGGVGLGLHIVKQLVTRLGGSLEVDSAPGRGSTFRVVMPRYQSDDADALRSSSPAAA